MPGYSKLTKAELLDKIEELETEARDTEATCDHVAKQIKECLITIGYDLVYCNKLSFYDLGDELEEVDGTLEEGLRGDGERHPLAYVLPEITSLGEREELKDDLYSFVAGTPPTRWFD